MPLPRLHPGLVPLIAAAATVLLSLGFLQARPFPDEGIFVTGGWLASQGLLPYRDFFDIHSPGIFFVLGSFYRLLGSGLGLDLAGMDFLLAGRLLAVLVNAATLLAIYFLARKIFDAWTGALAVVLHAVWLPVFYGFWAVIEPFTAFFSALSVLALHRVVAEKRREPLDLLWLGLALGFTLVFKQTLLVFVAAMVLVAAAYLIAYRQTRHLVSLKTLAAVAGLATPLLLVLLPYALSNALPALMQQTLSYAVENAGLLSNPGLKAEYLAVPLLLFFFTPLGFYWAARKGLNPFDSAFWERVILFAWLLSTLPNLFPFVGCCHHLLPLSPPAAIISAGVVMKIMGNHYPRLKKVAFLALLLVLALNAFVALRLVGKDEFKGVKEVAAFLQANSTQRDRIFVVHDDPEVYFLAQRLPATKYIYYPFLSPQGFQGMQAEIKADLQAFKPWFVVDFSGTGEPLNPARNAEAEQWVLDEYDKVKTFEFESRYNDYYRYAYVYQRKG
ncbi:MAG: glycosyltransferase family 39 protein [Candidatus Diapherotrites archaeon]|uniref:Glycosyltransferase family 39 protein n=1 Tax=Candidatus Iainarchaeum sp. TaxID=3101447 RepID=A0A8T4LDF9_9ARCH|nr:glycosyltransferase family 39 protein [Candidatus Diapherotrites archaeon]